MSKRLAVMICLLTLPFLFSSCADKEEGVVARVGEKSITVNDLKDVFRFRSDWSPEQMDSARTDALDRLIEVKLFALAGEGMGYRDDQEIQANLEYVKRTASIRELHRKVVEAKAEVKEGEIRRFYDQMAKDVKMSHIMVETKEQADSIYAELSREGGGRTWDELTKERSIDEWTKDKGGDLGWHNLGKLTTYDELLFAGVSLEVGVMSKPVKTPRGYHIIRVDDMRDAEREPYEEEKDRIESRLRSFKTRELALSYLEELKERSRIKIDEEVLQLLSAKTPQKGQKRFGAPPGLPQVTEEDRKRVLVRSSLGDWTVDKVLEMAPTAPRPPTFETPERAREFLESLLNNQLLAQEARRLGLDRSQRVLRQVENELDRMVAGKFYREQIGAELGVSEDELTDYYNAHIEDYTEGGEVKPFDEVKARVKNKVLGEKRETLKNEILSRLREETEVVINDENLQLVGAEM